MPKTATTQLQTFLAETDAAWRPSLYTLTMAGGTVYRWTSADVPVSDLSGNTFVLGPPIDDQGVQQSRGLSADTVDVNFYAQPGGSGAFLINGVPLTYFIETGGLVGATLKIERAFAAEPGDLLVGTYIAFAGRFSQIKQLTEMQAQVTFACWRELLDAYMPPEVFQTSCRNVLGDTNCTVNLAGLAVTGAVTSSTRTATSFSTNLTQADGYFGLGKIKFTLGANSGLVRTVKSYAHSSGLVTVVLALPNTPAVSDAFTIYPGCDLTMATCSSKFSNLAHFGGQPFVPAPETQY